MIDNCFQKRGKFYEDKIQEFVRYTRERVGKLEERLQKLEKFKDLEYNNVEQQKRVSEEFEAIRWILMNELTLKEIETEQFIDEWKTICRIVGGNQ